MLLLQEQGKFPSQPQSNPKGQHMAQASNSNSQNIKEVNTIVTQRGKILDGPTRPSPLNNKIIATIN